MYTDERITCFQFFIEYEGEDEEKIRNLKVDYWSDEEILNTENFGEVTSKELKILQKQLTEMVMTNLDIFDNWTKIKKLSKRNYVLGVANMFKIDILKEKDDMLDIEITFITSGKVMTSSVITKVKKSKIEKIKNILRDNTMYNLTCTQQCLAISYLDMLVLVKLNKQ